MKRFIMILVILCLVLASSPAVFASTAKIIDNADVLSYSQESDLSDLAEEISSRHDISVVIVTEEYLVGSTSSMADENFYYGGYGEDGILFILVMDSRDWEIATYGSVARQLSDSDTEDLFYAAKDDLAHDDYYDGFNAYLNALDDAMNSPLGGTDEEVWKQWLISLAIGAVVALIALLIMHAKMNTVRQQRAASEYMVNGSYHLTQNHDVYLYSNTTRTRRSQSSSSGGGGGGRSRGGSRGKF